MRLDRLVKTIVDALEALKMTYPESKEDMSKIVVE